MAEAVAPGEEFPDPRLIGRLLQALDVTCDPVRLARAAEETVAHSTEPEALLRWLRTVLITAEVPPLTPTLLTWQRFDPSKLPALVQQNGAWRLAEATDTGFIRLFGADGGDETVSAADLHDAGVLWIRRPQVNPADTPLTGNLAGVKPLLQAQ